MNPYKIDLIRLLSLEPRSAHIALTRRIGTPRSRGARPRTSTAGRRSSAGTCPFIKIHRTPHVSNRPEWQQRSNYVCVYDSYVCRYALVEGDEEVRAGVPQRQVHLVLVHLLLRSLDRCVCVQGGGWFVGGLR